MTINLTTQPGDTKDETLEKVDFILDKYLVEGEYWLQNTRTVLELQYRHHQYVHKTGKPTFGMYN